MKKLMALVIGLFLPGACLAQGYNLGPIMFLGDSITTGADGSNSGYRGYFIQDFNPPAGNHGVFPAPTGNQGILTPIGTSQQMASPYLESLDTPGYTNPYANNEGHPGATIEDLYDTNSSADDNEIATVSFDQATSTPGYTPQVPYSVTNPYQAPKYVYLMIGSNNAMGTPTQIATALSDELSLISYIKSVDSNLSRIFVEPPPSYPSQSEGNAPNGYDTFSSDLGASLLLAPYDTYTTFVNSRPELNSSADFAIENGDQQYLHPSDAGYQIIANDLYNATIAQVPEPSQLGLLALAATMLLVRARRTSAA